jgi:CheY-like chemotaxis protein
MKPKVLVIEDDLDIREVMKRFMEREGFSVTTADNGLEGLKHLESSVELPCIIFLDLMMPVMNGFQFREAQLKNDRIARIPTVIVSADGKLDDKKTFISADYTLKKPVDIDELLEIINKCCPEIS